MDFKLIKPSGILNKYIKHYWMLETGMADGLVIERVIPTGHIDLVFHYKKSLQVTKSDGRIYNQDDFFISGLSNSFSDVSSQNDIGMIAVVFKTESANLFFDFPLNVVENQSVNLKDVLKDDFNVVEDKLYVAENLFSRIQVIENFLLNQLYKNGNKQTELIAGAIQIINNSKGQLNAVDLANILGVSKRKLERNFSILLGKSPKKFINIVRFQSVLATSKNLTEEKLSNLDYDNGYFDQAHFINDFKSYTGYTPKEFFKIYDGSSDYFE